MNFSAIHSKVTRAYGLLVSFGNNLRSLVLLIVRLTWGWELYLSGYRHLTHYDSTLQAFKGWNVPMPEVNVYISGCTELVGGLALMLGFGARIIAIPLFFNFCVAYATASILSLKQFAFGGQYLSRRDYDPGRLSALEAIINDTAFPFMITSLLMLAFGAGRISVDYLLARITGKSRSAKM